MVACMSRDRSFGTLDFCQQFLSRRVMFSGASLNCCGLPADGMTVPKIYLVPLREILAMRESETISGLLHCAAVHVPCASAHTGFKLSAGAQSDQLRLRRRLQLFGEQFPNYRPCLRTVIMMPPPPPNARTTICL